MVKASRDQFGENILAVRILTLWWKLVVDHFGENIRAVRILTKECELHFYFSKSEITRWKLVDQFGENILAVRILTMVKAS